MAGIVIAEDKFATQICEIGVGHNYNKKLILQ